MLRPYHYASQHSSIIGSGQASSATPRDGERLSLPESLEQQLCNPQYMYLLPQWAVTGHPCVGRRPDIRCTG